jgi:hypothetical protein
MGMKQKRCPACRKQRPYEQDGRYPWESVIIRALSVLVCPQCAANLAGHHGARPGAASNPRTHLLKPGTLVVEMRLRCGLIAADTEGYLGSEDDIGGVDCAGCLRDLIVDMRCDALGPMGSTPEGRWLAGGDTGTSSLTIWSVMTGQPMPKGRCPGIPRDPADFGRCHRLLETFPAWRARLPKVAERFPAWAGLVAAWDELTELYLEELPSGQGPRLYARMTEIIEATENP